MSLYIIQSGKNLRSVYGLIEMPNTSQKTKTIVILINESVNTLWYLMMMILLEHILDKCSRIEWIKE